MEKFYEPDARWNMYHIRDKQEFSDNLVIQGYFHQNVPDDITQAYETAEYLMAHAYYHWPMYDEAFHKVLLTVEMGIKLKAKRLNIPTYRIKENGDKWYRNLSDVIDDICDETYLNDLAQKLHRSRELRNLMSHPFQNSFSGAIGGIDRNIKYCVNVLNRLFRNKEWHINQQERLYQANEVLNTLKNELVAFKIDKRGDVVFSIIGLDIIDSALFLVCLPILDPRKLEAKSNHFPRPNCYAILDYQLLSDKVIGKTLKGDEINIIPTKSNGILEAFKGFKEYLEALPKKETRLNLKINAIEAPWYLSNEEYNYLKECIY